MNLTFSSKLTLAQTLILVIFLIFAGTTWFYVSNIKNEELISLNTSYSFYKNAKQIEFEVVQIQQFFSDFGATRGEDGLDDGLKLAKDHFEKLQKVIQSGMTLAAENKIQKTKTILDEIQQASKIYYDTGYKMANLYKNGGTKAGNGFMENFDKASEQLQEKIKPLVLTMTADYEKNLATMENEANLLYKLSLFVPIGVVVFFIIFNFYFIGNLNQNFKKVVDGLVENSSDLESASSSLNENSLVLTDSVNEQMAAVNQSVAAMQEIFQTVNSNAEYSNNAKKATEVSVDVIKSGINTLNQVIASIEDMANHNTKVIEEMKQNGEKILEMSSIISEIESKTKIINEIVFQTKLLSFNASVEAARAGEQGKGFAVVAEEVGNLAELSGKAATEITSMLDSGLAKVNDIAVGTKRRVGEISTEGSQKISSSKRIIEDSKLVLDSILENVKKVQEMNTEIAASSVQQSQAIEEVNKAFLEIDRENKKNSNIAEESYSKSTQLKDQSVKLNHIIQSFFYFIEGKRNV